MIATREGFLCCTNKNPTITLQDGYERVLVISILLRLEVKVQAREAATLIKVLDKSFWCLTKAIDSSAELVEGSRTPSQPYAHRGA